jgi:hypothetical protein
MQHNGFHSQPLAAALDAVSTSAKQIQGLFRMQQEFFATMLHSAPEFVATAASSAFAMQEAALRTLKPPDATAFEAVATYAKQIENLVRMQQSFFTTILRSAPELATAAASNAIAMQELALRTLKPPEGGAFDAVTAYAKQVEAIVRMQHDFFEEMLRAPGARQPAEEKPREESVDKEFEHLSSKISAAFEEAVATAVRDHVQERRPVYGVEERK